MLFCCSRELGWGSVGQIAKPAGLVAVKRLKWRWHDFSGDDLPDSGTMTPTRIHVEICGPWGTKERKLESLIRRLCRLCRLCIHTEYTYHTADVSYSLRNGECHQSSVMQPALRAPSVARSVTRDKACYFITCFGGHRGCSSSVLHYSCSVLPQICTPYVHTYSQKQKERSASEWKFRWRCMRYENALDGQFDLHTENVSSPSALLSSAGQGRGRGTRRTLF
jgi:hypothetical protein